MVTLAVTETVVDVVEEIAVGVIIRVMVDTVTGGETTAALDT